MEVIAFLRCLILMVFVVAGGTFGVHCLSSMLDFVRYLSWPGALLVVIAFLGCLTLMLFVVAGGTFASHCLPSMLDFDAICGVPEHLAILLFVFDA